MGMYTELNLGVELKKETPKEVIETIHKCIDFPVQRDTPWAWAVSKCDSYYFDALPDVQFAFDDISESYYLTVRNNIKNYGGEQEKLLDFLSPWIESDGFIGYQRYEEDEHPTLLYAENGKVIKREAAPQIDALRQLYRVHQENSDKMDAEEPWDELSQKLADLIEKSI